MNLYSIEEKVISALTKPYEPYVYDYKLYKVYDNLNLFLPNISQYLKISGSDNSIIAMVRNIPISRTGYTIKNYKPSVDIYRDWILHIGNFRLFSYPFAPNIVFDKYFDTPVNVYNINMNESKINNLSFIPLYITFIEIINYTPSYTYNWFIYSENVLLISKFYPKYEYLLYPFVGNRLYSYYYNEFEYKNNETSNYILPSECKNSDYVADWDLTILRPKFLFSQNKTDWKKFDGTSFVTVTPSNGLYFTISDFMNNANTYTEYLSIPDVAWGDYEWYVMANCYIPLFGLNINKYIEDFVGATRILRYFNTNNLKDSISIWEL